MQNSNLLRAKVDAWVRGDRQWRREHRIRYARLMLRYANTRKDAEAIEFWEAVLSANGFVRDRLGKGSRTLPSTSYSLEKSLR